jgi:hypothetical protein
LTTDPTPCRPGYYQPDKEKSQNEDCIPCPIGYFCDAYGIGDYNKWECPVGHYCDEVAMITPPKVCPAGTYQPYKMMTNETDCLDCPEGHHCREGDEHPRPCDGGYKCKANSTKQWACDSATYCPAMSAKETACPESFHCPSYRTDIYSKCTNGTYCPEGSQY